MESLPRVGCFGLPECHFQNPSGASSGGGVDFCDELLAVRFWLDRRTRSRGRFMKVLTIDVGGTNVKLLVSGHEARCKFSSGPTMTAKQMVDEARKIAADWKYDVVSIGYPGPVLDGRLLSEPHNLAKGWVGFNFEKGFGCPVKVINDAAMQALGSYNGGRMLFLGLGTGLGSAMVINGVLMPMELAHLPYRKGTYEDYVGLRGLKRFGKKKWRNYVADVVDRLERRPNESGLPHSRRVVFP